MTTHILCDLRNRNRINCLGFEAIVAQSLNEILKHGYTSIIIDPRLIHFLPHALHISERDNIVVAIGSFDVVNLAGLACKHIDDCRLYTVPIPLTNDSFCMGRCNTSRSHASTECKRASRVYLSLKENIMLGPRLALLGLGEALSTVCSLRESLRYNLIPSRSKMDVQLVLQYILRLGEEVINKTYNKKVGNWIYRIVFSALLTKCNIAVHLGSHEHIARSDHSIGRVIEEHLKIPHGAAVLLSCEFLANYLLEPWETNLIKNINNLIIKYNKFQREKLPGLDFLIEKALTLRPEGRHPLILELKKVLN